LEGHSHEELGLDDDKAFEELRKRVRLEATQQSEANRRAGGIKTQRAMVRAWEVRFYASTFLKFYQTDEKPLGICRSRTGEEGNPRQHNRRASPPPLHQVLCGKTQTYTKRAGHSGHIHWSCTSSKSSLTISYTDLRSSLTSRNCILGPFASESSKTLKIQPSYDNVLQPPFMSGMP
jgi:hypothetical protein